MAFGGVNLNPRNSVASLAPRPSFDEIADEESTENSQLHRIREIGNRIAHDKAQTKSFSKYNQIRKIRIQLLGTGDDTSTIKKLKPTAYGHYSNYDSETVFSLKINDGWEGSDKEPIWYRKMGPDRCSIGSFESFDKQDSPPSVGNKKFNVQRNSWVGSENDYRSTNEDISQKAIGRSQTGRWSAVANRFRSGQFYQKGMSKNQRKQGSTSSMPQEDIPNSVQRDRTESQESSDMNKAQAFLKYQNKGKLPRLRQTDVKAFENLDSLLAKEATLKGKPDGGGYLLDQGTGEPSLLFSTTKGTFPSFKDERKSLTTLDSVGFGQNNNLLSNPEASLDDEGKRRKSLYQTRILGQFQDKKTFNQQQRANIDERVNNKAPFSTRMIQRRLSDEFRRLESCRYLRVYKMK